jgi:cardiolipin synthase
MEQRKARSARDPKRLLGIDRSGPAPTPTRAGQPWRPLTIPNFIGYVRLALIPAFVIIALGSATGRDWRAAVVFAVIAWSDYFDGFTARLTGQYSRLGTLLDPIVDRLLILCSMAVCWHFNLLPRWAIALAIARELLMLGVSRYGLAHGIDIDINWAGRIGVVPTMASPFFTMIGTRAVAVGLLICGLALTWTATLLYMRHGFRELRKLSS